MSDELDENLKNIVKRVKESDKDALRIHSDGGKLVLEGSESILRLISRALQSPDIQKLAENTDAPNADASEPAVELTLLPQETDDAVPSTSTSHLPDAKSSETPKKSSTLDLSSLRSVKKKKCLDQSRNDLSKKFVCKICKWRFAGPALLRAHMRKHYMEDGLEIASEEINPDNSLDMDGRMASEKAVDGTVASMEDVDGTTTSTEEEDVKDNIIDLGGQGDVERPTDNDAGHEDQTEVKGDDDEDESYGGDDSNGKPFSTKSYLTNYQPLEKKTTEAMMKSLHYSLKPQHKHVCHLCGWRFYRNNQLRKHLLAHSDFEWTKEAELQLTIDEAKLSSWYCSDPKKKSVCPLCEWRFRFDCTVKEHLLTVHGVKDPKELNPLMEKVTGKVIVDKSKKSQSADTCQSLKKSTDEMKASLHLCNDPNLKYKCHLCGWRFVQCFQLKNHLSNHSDFEWNKETKLQFSITEAKLSNWYCNDPSKKAVCPLCGWRFVHNHSIRTHLRRVHDIEDTGEEVSFMIEGQSNDAADTDEPTEVPAVKPADTPAGKPADSRKATRTSGRVRKRKKMFDDSDDDGDDDDDSKDEGKYTTEQFQLMDQYCDDAALDYECGLCGWRFGEQILLTRHLRLHQEATTNKERTPAKKKDVAPMHKCSHCGWSFKMKYQLTQHVNNRHGRESANRCTDDGEIHEAGESPVKKAKVSHSRKAVSSNANKRDSSPQETGSSKDTTGKAQQDSSTEANNQSEDQLEANAGDGIISLADAVELLDCDTKKPSQLFCGKCGEIFADKEDLLVHEETHKEKPFTCTVCAISFALKSELNAHKEAEHPKNHQCIKCERKFMLPGALKAHMESNCGLAHKCDFCHEYYPSLKDLERHCQAVHPEESQCEYCQKQFFSLRDLNSHKQNKHLERAAHQCSKCDRRLFTKKALDNHYITAHPESLECEVCQKTFIGKKSLFLHYKTHKGFKPYKCEFCGKSYSGLSSHNQHLAVKHPIESGLGIRCSVCPRRFMSEEERTRHESSAHQDQEVSVCDVCGESFSSNLKLRNHAKKHDQQSTRHKRKADGDFSCEHCFRTFPTMTSRRYHMRVHTGEKPFACEVCGRGYASKKGLKNHVMTEHEGVLYECPICQKRFKQETQCKIHVMAHTYRPFKCDQCPSTFVDQKGLKLHIDAVHLGIPRNKKRVFTCPYCPEVFHSKVKLRHHAIIHPDTPTYNCQICNRMFKIESQAIEHFRRHETGVPKVYDCRICKIKFATRQEHDDHRAAHVAKDEYLQKCEQCGKGFFKISLYRRHMLRHNDVKAHGCELCDRRFTSSKALTSHVRSKHTGERPYMCEFCNKCFTASKLLRDHQTTHTGEKRYPCKYCGIRFGYSTQKLRHEDKCGGKV